ncbi:MAG: hypothetical protein ACYTFI_09350 [Planctomycetota bacterium]
MASPDRRPLSPWSRVALTGLSVLFIVLPNLVTTSSAFIDRTGWPFTFVLYSGWTGETSLVIHGLVLDVAIWAGIVLTVWYAAGRHTERKATRRSD